MIEIGRMCVKIAGRDAGKKCVIVDVIDNKTVLIDGQTRRRKCNVNHIEPLDAVLKIKKGASHSDIAKEFSKLKLEARETKPKKTAAKPTKSRKKKEKAEPKEAGKEPKKADKKGSKKK